MLNKGGASLDSAEIETNFVVEANYGDKTFYVFPVKVHDSNDTDIYNAEVRLENGIVKDANIVAYYPTEEWLQNRNYSLFSGTVTSYDFSGNELESMDYIAGKSDCPNEPDNPPGGPSTGPGSGDNPPPGDPGYPPNWPPTTGDNGGSGDDGDEDDCDKNTWIPSHSYIDGDGTRVYMWINGCGETKKGAFFGLGGKLSTNCFDGSGVIIETPAINYLSNLTGLLSNLNVNLSSSETQFLNSNRTLTRSLLSYLSSNNNLQGAQFVQWAVVFFVQNPNTSLAQFENWFITNTPNGFLQQIILENPATVLNYESLNSPYFKMRRLDQIKYPKFTQMVKVLKAYVQSNPVILNKLIEISGMTQSQILDKLTFGQGPQIELIPGLLVYGQPAFGAFDHSNPNILMVNENFAMGLQQTTNSVTEQATSFLLAVTILHEFVHYGNYLTGYDTNGQETGNLFENEVFGIKINKVTAHQYIVRFLNK